MSVTTVRLGILLAVVALWSFPAFGQCPDAITNLSPASTTPPSPTSGTLSWSIANGAAADYFIVYFGEQGNGCSVAMLTTSTGGSSFTVNYDDLAPNTTYEWRVEAVKNGCVTVSSSCVNFRTACPTAGPTLISPPDEATDDHLKTTFAWDPVFGAVGYDVYVEINGAPATKVGSTTTATELTIDIPPGMHRWWVEALFNGCPPARSTVWTFGTACPSAPITLISPPADSSEPTPQDVKFEWTAVSGADGYDVYILRNGETVPTKIGETRENETLAATTITVNLPGPGTYTWFVDVLSSGCPNRKSGNGVFTVRDVCPTTPPRPIAPANGASGLEGEVQFSWEAIPNDIALGLTGYNVWVAINDEPAAVVATTTESTATVRLPPGTHQWYVDAEFTTCPRLTSIEKNTFTIATIAVCPESGPSLEQPPNGATNVSSPVEFRWTEIAGAVYIVRAGVNGETPTEVAQSTTNSATVHLPPGEIAWDVVAIVEGCDPIPSAEVHTVTVGPNVICPEAGPELVEPISGVQLVRQSNDPPVTLVWKKVEGARSYAVTVVRDGVPVTIPGIEDTILQGHEATAGPGTYRWSVVAELEGCEDEPSEERSFTVTEPPPCVVPSPVALVPASGDKPTSQIVNFQWTEAENAAYYRVFARTDPDSEEFTLIGSTAGGTELEVTLPFGPWQWYVEAVGRPGCPTTRSLNAPSFVLERADACRTESVELDAPNRDVNITNPVQFVWQLISGAIGYQVVIRPAGGSETPITEVTTASSATAVLPAGEVEWWVVAFFPGCDPTESEHRIVTVAECSAQAPRLLAPLSSSGKVTAPVSLSWTQSRGATSYDVFLGLNGEVPAPIGSVRVVDPTREETQLNASVEEGTATWYVRARVPGCAPLESARGDFTVIVPPPCSTPEAPSAGGQARATSGQQYAVVWGPVANSTEYELEESLSPDFATSVVKTVTDTRDIFSHSASLDTKYYYRIRARSSCNGEFGPYSNIVTVTITGSRPDAEIVTRLGTQRVVVRSVFFPGVPGVTLRFNARTDKPWLTVEPSSGELPPSGITLTLLADPSDLQPGTNNGTIIVDTFAPPTGRIGTTSGSTSTTVPVSVNLAAPVTPGGKNEPPPDSLIVLAVGATRGANNSLFQSDVRIANVAAQAARYGIIFTPTATDATRVSHQATVDIAAGQTLALDSLIKTWFGAAESQNILGVLEVRPLKTGATTSAAARGRSTIGSSRTFNSTPNGTFGQFIPAVPFSRFAGVGKTLSLTHVARSDTFRSNLGLVEGSGQPATVRINAYGSLGNLLGSFDVDLKPGEHRQISSVLAPLGVTTDNARVDVSVVSATGRVSAYVSTLDNRTNDPLLITGTDMSAVSDSRFVLPGIAHIDTGAARWRSEIRLFNAGSAPVNATLSFHRSENPAEPVTINTVINPGETKQFQNVLQTHFNTTGGGSVIVQTSAPASLLASARTYNDTGAGTAGQLIPAVSLKQSAGRESGALHVLQLEQSDQFRSNVGVAEVSGNPAIVEIMAVLPDSKVIPRVQFELRANEFRQFNGLLQQMGIERAYNTRVAVRVVGGNGRITAYGSVVDNASNDPTFVPAEQ